MYVDYSHSESWFQNKHKTKKEQNKVKIKQTKQKVGSVLKNKVFFFLSFPNFFFLPSLSLPLSFLCFLLFFLSFFAPFFFL
jgi:hypothetical protein